MTSGHYWKLDEAKHLLTFLFHRVKNKYVKIKNWFKLSEQTLNWISLILLIYILILMFFCLMINSMIMLSQHIVRQKLYKKYILNIIHICSTTENLPVHVLGCSFGVLYSVWALMENNPVYIYFKYINKSSVTVLRSWDVIYCQAQ